MAISDLLFDTVNIKRPTNSVLESTSFTPLKSVAPTRQPFFKGRALINVLSFTSLSQLRVVGSLAGVSQSESLLLGSAVGSCQFLKTYDTLTAFESVDTTATISVSWVTPSGQPVYKDAVVIGPVPSRVVNKRNQEWNIKDPGAISIDLYSVVIGASNESAKTGDKVSWKGDDLHVRTVLPVYSGSTVAYYNMTCQLIPR